MPEITPVRAPVESVNDTTVAVVEWLVHDGDFVEAGTPIVILETAKTSFDLPAPTSGVVWRVAAQGSDVPVDAALCHIGPDVEATRARAESSAASHATESPGRGTVADDLMAVAHAAAPVDVTVGVEAPARGRVGDPDRSFERTEDADGAALRPPRLSERAAVLARELSMEAAAFEGHLLVREHDVLRLANAAGEQRPPATRPEDARAGTAVGRTGATAVRLSRAKRVEGDQIRAAYSHTVPSSVTVPVPSDGRLFSAEQDGVPGVLAATLIFEVARLLPRYPGFNAYHEAGLCHLYEAVNIGYAIDLELGLKVVVIKDADRKTVRQILDEKQQLIVDYLNESLSPAALSGATFTITDLSATGAVHVQPVLSERQSAVLGVCALVPAVNTFNLVLRFDHQVADGRSATAFLEELRDRLVGHEQSLPKPVVAAAPQPEPECALCLRAIHELEDVRHFLVRAVPAAGRAEQLVCTICLQDWYA